MAATQAYLAIAAWRPRDPLPYLRCGQIYLQQRRLPLAEKALWHSYTLNPQDADILSALGDLYSAQGLAAHAASWYRKARDLTPHRAEINCALGMALVADGDLAEAEEAFKAALAADPDARLAHYQLGLLLAAKNPDDAIRHLRAVSRDGDQVAAMADRLLAELNNIAQATDAIERAGQLGLAYMRQGAWTLSRDQLQLAADLASEHAEIRAYLGYVLYRLGDYQEAERNLRQALALAPQDPRAYHFMGMLYNQLHCSHAALQMLERAYDLDPGNPAIAADIAQAYLDAGAYDQAELWFEEAAQLAPDSVDYALLQAAFHIRHVYHVRQKGIPAAERAIALRPEEATAHSLLGHALLLVGDHARAYESLSKALSLDPNLAEAHYYLAELYMQRGFREATESRDLAEAAKLARLHYQRALDLATTDDLRQRAQEGIERAKVRQPR